MSSITEEGAELPSESVTATDATPPHVPVCPITRRHRAIVVGVLLVVALFATLVASASMGQFQTSFSDVLESLWNALLHGVDPHRSSVDSTLWSIRFPRVGLAMLVGACLAVAGAMMQGVFANPLAEPSIIGVNSGASVGAGIVFVFGLSAGASWFLPVAAFVGAFGTVMVVWALSRAGGTASVITLILTGIAVNAVAVASTSFLVFLGDRASREQIIFWQLGTFSGATWTEVAVTACVFFVGFVACMALRKQVDVLALGDDAASSTGVAVDRLRFVAVVLVSVLTAVAVAFAGVIAFVGLIIPHAMRIAVGPSHRYLIPLSALGGALLLSLADMAARNIVPFGDLPIGIFTAVVGGPLFLMMLRHTLSGYRLGRS